MTYSEVREMYSVEMAEMIEERERTRKTAAKAIEMVFGWVFPSIVTAMAVVLGLNMLNAKGIMSVVAMLSLTFVLWFKAREEEMPYRLFVSAFTWLVATAAVVAM